MSRYLLDTNVLLHVVNGSQGHERIRHHLEQTPKGAAKISAVTVWEIARMVEKAKAKTRATEAALAMMGLFDVVPMDASGASMGGTIHALLANKGLTIGERDSMIAGMAVIHGFIMVTDNVKEFERVPGLPVVNWRTS